MIAKAKRAAQAAIGDTEVTLTSKLRQSALEHGWHPDVVANMHVQHGSNGFNVNIHPDYMERAHIHEYGNETTRPTAAIRKFSTDKAAIHGAFVSSINQRYKGKK